MSERGTTKSRYLLCCQKLNPGVLHSKGQKHVTLGPQKEKKK